MGPEVQGLIAAVKFHRPSSSTPVPPVSLPARTGDGFWELELGARAETGAGGRVGTGTGAGTEAEAAPGSTSQSCPSSRTRSPGIRHCRPWLRAASTLRRAQNGDRSAPLSESHAQLCACDSVTPHSAQLCGEIAKWPARLSINGRLSHTLNATTSLRSDCAFKCGVTSKIRDKHNQTVLKV